jgi:hypothetical protein
LWRGCSKLLTIDNKCRSLCGGFQLSPALRSCREFGLAALKKVFGPAVAAAGSE